MSQKPKPAKFENLGRGITKRRRHTRTKRADKSEFVHSADLPQEEVVVTRSIVEQNSLDTFLQLAELADTKFVGERQAKLVANNAEQTKVRIESVNAAQSQKLAEKMNEALDRIGRLPQRVKFTESMTTAQFGQLERGEFLKWRRQLSELEEKLPNAVMTPYERNALIWREFWRVFERSDVIVQVLDARNPMLFRCAEVERHTTAANKRNVLLLNKADYLTPAQRLSWLKYFEQAAPGCVAILFSAKRESEKMRQHAHAPRRPTLSGGDELDAEKQNEPQAGSDLDADAGSKNPSKSPDSESEHSEEDQEENRTDEHGDDQDDADEDDEEDFETETESEGSHSESEHESDEKADKFDDHTEDNPVDPTHKRDRLLSGLSNTVSDEEPGDAVDDAHLSSVTDLLRFLASLTVTSTSKPTQKHDKVDEAESEEQSESEEADRSREVTIGFVGYPNVGKSSTINALLGRKRVAVSATPGKTKHLQTFKLDLASIFEDAEASTDESNAPRSQLSCQSLTIADCPGLVFVNAVATRADLVLNGVLSTDQLGDPLPATAAVCRLFDRHTLVTFYGLEHVLPRPTSWQPSDRADPDALLTAIAVSRSLMASHGVPNRSAAARFILRDFLNGKLLYCEPPPGCSSEEFQPTVRVAQLVALAKPPAPTPAIADADKPVPARTASSKPTAMSVEQAFDERFFARMNDVQIGTRGISTNASSYRVRPATAADGDGTAGSVQSSMSNLNAVRTIRDLPKKHHNHNKREKLRRVYKHLDN